MSNCTGLHLKKKRKLLNTQTREMNGWMICDFTSFSTVFQSYQDDGQMIMKDCVPWNSFFFMVEKILP